MEEEDIQQLFAYIRDSLPNCKSVPKLTRSMARALCNAFEGYSYEQVENAVTQHVREKRFWPDTSELIAYLPSLASKSEVDWLHKWANAHRAELRSRGFLTALEARTTGVTLAEWMVQVDGAGV